LINRILLFGGTFDPIHYGHMGLLDIVSRQLNIDDVFLIPTKQPPWKSQMAPLEHRLEMVRLALPDSRYHVCTYEIEQEGINYSIDTVKHFKELYPTSDIYYLIGTDQAALFHEWKDALNLSRLAHIVVYNRLGYQLPRANVETYRMMVIEGKRFEISSTDIRALKCLDTPWPVIDYILDHDLYFTAKLSSYYEPKRLKHVRSVAKLAYDIAVSNKENGSKAAIAGLLHDIGKLGNQKEYLKLLIEEDPKLANVPSFSIHQYAGAYLARKDFGIDDEEILDAIAYHASGKPNMNWLGEIIYSADKIEPLRGFDSKSFIEACMADFHQGFIDVLRANYEYHTEIGKPFKYHLTAEAMKYYLGEHE